jgi:hypothetical protein
VAPFIPGPRNQACHNTIAAAVAAFIPGAIAEYIAPYHSGSFHSWSQEPSLPQYHSTHAAVAAFIPGARNQACHSTLALIQQWLLSFLVPGTKHATVPYHPSCCGCFHSWCQEPSQPQAHTTHVTMAAIMPGARDQVCYSNMAPMPLLMSSFLVPRSKHATVPDPPCRCGCFHSWYQEPSLPQYNTTPLAMAACIPGTRNQACNCAIPPMPLCLLSFLVLGTKLATVP